MDLNEILKDLSGKMDEVKKKLTTEEKAKCDRYLKRYQEALKNGTPPPPPLKF